MTFPDTLDIADAAQATAPAAAERLRLLHRLGQTAESTVEQMRAARDAAEARAADLPARTAERDSLKAERDSLRDQLDALTAPRAGVPITEFRRRLIPLRLGLASAPEAVRARWLLVLPELDHFTTVYPDQSPVSDLIALAEADGLVTAAQAAALRQV